MHKRAFHVSASDRRRFHSIPIIPRARDTQLAGAQRRQHHIYIPLQSPRIHTEQIFIVYVYMSLKRHDTTTHTTNNYICTTLGIWLYLCTLIYVYMVYIYWFKWGGYRLMEYIPQSLHQIHITTFPLHARLFHWFHFLITISVACRVSMSSPPYTTHLRILWMKCAWVLKFRACVSHLKLHQIRHICRDTSKPQQQQNSEHIWHGTIVQQTH